MATMILGAVGSAVGGPVGGFVGAFVGGLVDNFLLFPALFPKPTIKATRINELAVSSGAEGQGMPWPIGPRNRIGGQIMWLSDLIAVKNTKKVGKGGGSQKVESFVYYVDVAIFVADVTNLPESKIDQLRKVMADAKAIYDMGDSDKYESLTFYDGTQTTADPTMEATDGVGNVPAYINSAYIMVKRLALADFGVRLPNLASIAQQQADMSLGEAIAAILERSGLTEDDYNVDRLPQCFRGMTPTGPVSGADSLAPLLVGYSVFVQEANGQLVFIPRGAETIVEVDTADLAAHESGSDAPRPFEIDDNAGYRVPSSVTVQFVSTDNDLQPGSEQQRRAYAPSRDAATADLGISLRPEEARAAAKRLLWQAEAERQAVEVSLPPSYVGLNEGDVLKVTHNGADRYIFANEVSRGANYRVIVSGFFTDPSVFDQDGDAAEPGEPPSGLSEPIETSGATMDLPALTTAQLDQLGVYFAVCALDPGAVWRGAFLYESTSEGGTYTEVTSVPGESTMGTVTNFLDAGPTLFWDNHNTIEVELLEGGLESATEEEVLAGANRAAIQTEDGSWEIVGWVNAELVSTRVYRLSKLLRGQRGTEHLVGLHVPGSTFVELNTTATGFAERGAGSLGSTMYYKYPALGGNLEDFDVDTEPYRGVTMRPFSPCRLEAEWDSGSDDFTATWERRSKVIASPFSSGANSLLSDEVPETYEVEFRAGGLYAPILRTVTVNTPTVTYTSADQATDGLTPGVTPITVTVYQISQIVGRSPGATRKFMP